VSSTAPSLGLILTRFWLGTLAGVASGLLVFGRTAVDPTQTAFYCVSVGTVFAGVLALVRCERVAQALVLVLFYAVMQRLIAGWLAAATALVIGVGAVLVALIFDLLARKGIHFGKFLIAGPLLGGVFLAAAPLAEFHTLTSMGAVRTLMYYGYIGVLIGDGVGLGVEVADLGALALEKMNGAPAAVAPEPTAPDDPR
jgi:hypothetical protein